MQIRSFRWINTAEGFPGYAKKEAEAFPAISLSQEPARQPDFKRCPIANADLKGNDRIKMKTMGKEAVMINKEMIDLRYVEQIVDSEQVTALGYCMRYAQKHLMNGKKDLRQVIAEMEKVIEKESLDALCESKSSITHVWRCQERRKFLPALTDTEN